MDVVYGFPFHTCPAPEYLCRADGIARLARAAEAAGFTAVDMTDHPAPSQAWRQAGGHDGVDPFVGLAFAAAATSEIRLLTYLTVLPYRNPFHLAKTVASLDALSGGRVELGVGAGYLRSEFAALGVSWQERNALFDEAVSVLRAAFTGEPVTYQGRHFSARDTVTTPACARPGGPPLWIGGNSRLSRRRVVDLGAGWLPLPNPAASASFLRSPAMETVADFRRLLEEMHADARARDLPAPSRVLYHMPPTATDDEMDAHARLASEVVAAGASGIVVHVPAAETVDESEEWIGRYYERVMSTF